MKVLLQNKKVYFEYTVLDKYICGIQLTGTEVKSIRDLKTSLSESYCHFIDGELYVVGMHISEYKLIKHTNHTPNRNRKLLLNKNEIKKLQRSVKEKGLTIVPISILNSETGLIKLEIGLVKGKKSYDKKESIKEKDIQRYLSKNK